MKLYEYVLRIKEQGMEKLRQFASAAGVAEGQGEKLRKTIDNTSSSSKALDNTLGTLKRQLATVFAVGSLVSFVGGVTNTTAKAEGLANAIGFASGNSKETAVNMAFLEGTSNKLGLSLEASQQGYKTLSAAMMGSKLQGQATRNIFEGVATGAAAMNLTSEQAEGAFLALGQMMGKGKVSAEELRGQLGERIPGAFQIAARAMGVSTSQLDKMMSQGKLVSEDFLPKFANEMRRTFEGALPTATQSLQANLNRMHNQWYLTQQFFGNQLKPVITKVVQGLSDLMFWTRENWGTVTALASVVAYATGIYLAYQAGVLGATLVTGIYNGVMATARLVTLLFTGGFAKLNTVMMLNPVGLVVASIFALIGGFILAYNKLEWFRGGVHGLWESLKELGHILMNGVVKIFKGLLETVSGLGTALWRVLKGDFKGAAQAGEQALGGLKKMGEGLVETNPLHIALNHGEKLANKFHEGYEKGKKAKAIGFGGLLNGLAPGGKGSALEAMASSANTSKSKDDTKDGINAISGGGSKAVNVTVQIGKFQDKTELHVTNLEEGITDIEGKFIQMFARLLNGGLYAATQ